MDALRVAVYVLVAVVGAGASQVLPPVLEIGDVRIVPGTISISAIVHIGLRNNSDVARRVCVGASHLAVRPAGDSYAEGGVLDCQDASRFVSIPPRGVHVVSRSVLRQTAGPDASIQIGMLLFHLAEGDAGVPQMIDVEWAGTVRDAEAAGVVPAR